MWLGKDYQGQEDSSNGRATIKDKLTRIVNLGNIYTDSFGEYSQEDFKDDTIKDDTIKEDTIKDDITGSFTSNPKWRWVDS